MNRAFLALVVALFLVTTGVSPAARVRPTSSGSPRIPPQIPEALGRHWHQSLLEAIQAIRDQDYLACIAKLEPWREVALRQPPNRFSAQTFSYLGAARLALREQRASLRDLLEARRIARQIGAEDRLVYGSILFNLSNLYFDLRAWPEARATANEALNYVLLSEDQRNIVAMLVHKARLESLNGSFGEAEASYEEATRRALAYKDQRLLILVWQTRGYNYLWLKRLEAARAALEHARTLAMGAPRAELAVIDVGLADVVRRLGQPDVALWYLAEAFDSVKRQRGRLAGWVLYLIRARALADQGRFDAALADCRRALADVEESGWYFMPADALRVNNVSSAHEVYTEFIRLSARILDGRRDPRLVAESFEVAERSRALGLRVAPQELDRVRAILPPGYFQLLGQLQASYSSAYREDSREASDRLMKIRLELMQMEAAAGLSDLPGEVGSHWRPDSGNLISSLRRSLGRDSAIVSFHCGEVDCYSWAVTSDDLLFTRLPPRLEISRKIEVFVQAVRGHAPAMRELGSALYQTLFGKSSSALRTRGRWYLVPDDALHQMPFGSLTDPSGPGPVRYLAEVRVLSTIPGAWVLRPSPKQSAFPLEAGEPARLFLGVGDPIYNAADSRMSVTSRPKAPAPFPWLKPTSGSTISLPRLAASEPELASCGRAYLAHRPGAVERMLLGPDARWEQVVRWFPMRPEVLHFAVHVVPSPDNGRESLIALSSNGSGDPQFVGPELIAARRQSARLVVLGGCRSAKGEVKPGEGLMGLTRAWMLAGAEAVVASHWPTMDESGGLLVAFYQCWRPGDSVALALAQAQREMILSGGWRAEPRYWASYFAVAARP